MTKLFFFFLNLTYSRWTSLLPSCLWSQRILPSLPGSRLTFFLSRCKFSTLTTRQPGRGGTCDISAWDAFYLAMFWMLNTIGWVTFYWHWKHVTIWQGNAAQFNESSNYSMGWLRDYLWLNSSPLINGYNPYGMNSLSVWAWMFLFGHLVWARP